ncbi:hypothetical protein HX021_08335 [Sphingobacterium sp. N143]|uniref:hypothetical protein n=1 Tax=Sphingobacterium sp. N143 TaxID=2746727 RepID=UPI002575A755|nr:hypothetical protein [Sphingobacterium sp. N143]MDM1294305.1 hypothetical protein [Sphingobacterium sp. N143]
MKWFILILMVSTTYSDASTKIEVIRGNDLVKPIEDVVPKLDSLAGKLTDLSTKIEKL